MIETIHKYRDALAFGLLGVIAASLLASFVWIVGGAHQGGLGVAEIGVVALAVLLVLRVGTPSKHARLVVILAIVMLGISALLAFVGLVVGLVDGAYTPIAFVLGVLSRLGLTTIALLLAVAALSDVPAAPARPSPGYPGQDGAAWGAVPQAGAAWGEQPAQQHADQWTPPAAEDSTAVWTPPSVPEQPQAAPTSWNEQPASQPWTPPEDAPAPQQSAYEQPQYAQPQYEQPQYGQPDTYAQPQYDQAQYDQAQYAQPDAYGQPQYEQADTYAQPQYDQAQYAQPQYGQPDTYAQPQYEQPQAYAQPQYGQPDAYGQPQYGQPDAYGQPQYEQPQYEQPQAYGQPQYGQPDAYEQPQYEQPQAYAQPQYEQPQYEQPQYEQPQYEQPQYAQPPEQPVEQQSGDRRDSSASAPQSNPFGWGSGQSTGAAEAASQGGWYSTPAAPVTDGADATAGQPDQRSGTVEETFARSAEYGSTSDFTRSAEYGSRDESTPDTWPTTVGGLTSDDEAPEGSSTPTDAESEGGRRADRTDDQPSSWWSSSS